MQPCHTVYGIACRDRQMRHLDLSVIEDRHLAHLLVIARIQLLNPHHKSSVDLLDDLVDTGQKS